MFVNVLWRWGFVKWTIFSNLVRFLCKFRSHLVLPGVPKKFLEPPLSLFLHAFLQPPGVTRLLKTVLRDFQSELGILLRLFGPPGAFVWASWCDQAAQSNIRRPPDCPCILMCFSSHLVLPGFPQQFSEATRNRSPWCWCL